MFTPDTLHGKTILVTGGGSGLGLAMAKGFAAAGASIAICGRTQEKLDRAADELRSLTVEGARVEGYAVDVRDFEGVGGMFEQIHADFGGSLNGLVNNAAGNFLSASEDLSPGGFKAVVDIVLHGTFNCTHRFGNRLIADKRPGTVLNIATTYAEHSGSAFVLPSACAKAGVLALTRSLAYEWATYDIRLNAIAPGPFPTEGAWTRLLPSKRYEKAYLKKLPTGRYGRHEELAQLAVFLMSDLSPYITGECVTIDGGESLAAGQFNFIDTLMPRPMLKKAFRMLRGSKGK